MRSRRGHIGEVSHSLAALPLSLLLSACLCIPPAGFGVGNSGTDVFIRNGGSEQLTVTEVGQGPSGSDLVSGLGPGEQRPALWHFTSGSLVTLRATAASGGFAYCHRFSYEEIRRTANVVAIVESKNDCK